MSWRWVAFHSTHPTQDLIRDLFAYELNQDALPATTVELTVEDLLPGTEVQLTAGDRDDYLTAHDLPLQMGVSVVLAGAVVAIMADGLVRSQPLQPILIVLMEATFIIVDEHRSGYVHSVDECESLHDIALSQTILNLGRDVDEGPAPGNIEPEFLSVIFHLLHSCVLCYTTLKVINVDS